MSPEGSADSIRSGDPSSPVIEQAWLLSAVHDAPIGIVLVGVDGCVKEVNRAFCSLVDRPSAEVVGEPFEAFFHRDDVAAGGALPGGERSQSPSLLRLTAADGTDLWVLVTSVLVADGGTMAGRAIAYVVDTSQHMQLDIEREAALVERDRLIAGVSHTIRSPLTSVCAAAEELFVGWETFTGEERQELLQLLVDGSRRAALTIDNFVIAARQGPGTIRVDWDLVDLPHEVRTVAAGLAGESRLVMVTQSVRVIGDALRVRQVLHNLLALTLAPPGARGEIVVAPVGHHGVVRVTSLHADLGGAPPRYPVGEMGWFVARRLAELMGGALTRVDRAASTTFELRLQADLEPAPGNLVNQATK